MIDHTRLFQRVNEQLAGSVRSTTVAFGEPVIEVDRAATRDLLRFLKEDDELSYGVLVELFGMDYLPEDRDPRFEMVYILRSEKHNGRVTVKTPTNENGMETMSDLWKSANWFEREAFDMFGITFKGHPDLHRIYNDDDFDGYPLRKDYPTEGYDFNEPFVVDLEKGKA